MNVVFVKAKGGGEIVIDRHDGTIQDPVSRAPIMIAIVSPPDADPVNAASTAPVYRRRPLSSHIPDVQTRQRQDSRFRPLVSYYFPMMSGWIPFVFIPVINRVFFMDMLHKIVTISFCKYRCSCN